MDTSSAEMVTGEGNGTPLQCSCLENPRDGGAWWAAVYGIAQSRTRLKRLSSSRWSCESSQCQYSGAMLLPRGYVGYFGGTEEGGAANPGQDLMNPGEECVPCRGSARAELRGLHPMLLLDRACSAGGVERMLKAEPVSDA